MYVFPNMIDLGLRDGEKWPSEDHKIVAQNALLCNSRVNSRTVLMEYCEIINQIPAHQIRTVTALDLRAMGVPLP